MGGNYATAAAAASQRTGGVHWIKAASYDRTAGSGPL
jgi:hypothetical protein